MSSEGTKSIKIKSIRNRDDLLNSKTFNAKAKATRHNLPLSDYGNFGF